MRLLTTIFSALALAGCQTVSQPKSDSSPMLYASAIIKTGQPENRTLWEEHRVEQYVANVRDCEHMGQLSAQQSLDRQASIRCLRLGIEQDEEVWREAAAFNCTPQRCVPVKIQTAIITSLTLP